MPDSEVDDRFKELVVFIQEKTGTHDVVISRQTLVENDLGVTGDDAYDLVIAFSKKYDVDISNFIFKKYFYPEPSIFDWRSHKIAPFTVGHLEKAVIAKKLDEEVING